MQIHIILTTNKYKIQANILRLLTATFQMCSVKILALFFQVEFFKLYLEISKQYCSLCNIVTLQMNT